MQIIRDDFYLQELDSIVDFIAQRNIVAAINFLDKIDTKIDNLFNMPFKFRKSHYYQDEYIRDLIFKGYTIPYLIDEDKDKIVILDIFKWSSRDKAIHPL